jgi:hypothetical protein
VSWPPPVTARAFPHERQWIDFKRRLYPGGGQPAAQARDKVSQELTRDLASMAEAGGFLVYGVKEDKAGHSFTPDEMNLPVGLHETVDAVARDRITPPLNVIPTLVPNPVTKTTGFLVVEIPESPDSPHMADYTYWGKSASLGWPTGCRPCSTAKASSSRSTGSSATQPLRPSPRQAAYPKSHTVGCRLPNICGHPVGFYGRLACRPA